MDNNNETKRLIKKKTHRELLTPTFLSGKFLQFLRTLNIIYIVYIITTTLGYIILTYTGNSLIKSNSSRSELLSALFLNIYINIYLSVLTIVGFLTITKESMKYFILYWTMTALISFSYAMGYFSSIKTFYFQNEKLLPFNMLMLTINSIFLIYSTYSFFWLLEYNRGAINKSTTPTYIIHEIKLRTDMMKIGFNQFLINTKLSKIFPQLLYKPNSYYFNTIRHHNHKENNSIHIESRLNSTAFNSID